MLPNTLQFKLSISRKKLDNTDFFSLQEQEPPTNIYDTKSEFIFFQTNVPGHTDKMQFESSLYKGHFLGCKKEKDLYKLILKKKDDKEDKSVLFSVQTQNQIL